MIGGTEKGPEKSFRESRPFRNLRRTERDLPAKGPQEGVERERGAPPLNGATIAGESKDCRLHSAGAGHSEPDRSHRLFGGASSGTGHAGRRHRVLRSRALPGGSGELLGNLVQRDKPILSLAQIPRILKQKWPFLLSDPSP